jgi:hypothetical protein
MIGTPDKAQFLHALVSANPDALDQWLATNTPDVEWLRWLQGQRLAPYVFYSLRRVDRLHRLPCPLQDGLRASYHAAAVRHLLFATEMGALAADLAQLGVTPIVLKGMALATTLYPSPATRPTSDLDFLIERDQIEPVKQCLIARGYQDDGFEIGNHQTFDHHLQMSRRSRHGQMIMVEAHWRLVHDPAYGRQMDLQGVRARAQALDCGGHPALGLDPLDQFLHACAHLLLHHAETWDLLWLLYLRLLLDRYGTTWDWGEVIRRSREFGIAGGLRYWLGLVEEWYGLPLPPEAVQALASEQPGDRERRYIERSQAGYIEEWRWDWEIVMGLASWQERLDYLSHKFFPPWAYMQHRYGVRGRWAAPFYYGWRLVRAGLVAFRRVGSG